MRNSQPSALKLPMRSRTGVQVDLLTLPKGVCLLDTEEKLLQAIQDLLPLAKTQKQFQDNQRWSAATPVTEVFHVFWLKLLGMIGPKSAKIQLQQKRYQLVVQEAVYFDVNCPVMPVYFLPVLEQVDKPLFELAFYLICLLHDQADIEYWEEDNDTYIYENIEGQLADYKSNQSADGSNYQKEIAALEQAHRVYAEQGPATLFEQRLKHAGASKSKWLKTFAEFVPKTKLEKDFHSWMKTGRELVVAGESIHKYISLPEEIKPNEEGYYDEQLPSTPDKTVRFLWSVDDWWWGEFESMEESVSNEAGGLPFLFEKVVNDFAELKKTDKDSFPAKVLRFMKEGRALEKKYRASFASPELLKKLVAAQRKPKYLLDIL